MRCCGGLAGRGDDVEGARCGVLGCGPWLRGMLAVGGGGMFVRV